MEPDNITSVVKQIREDECFSNRYLVFDQLQLEKNTKRASFLNPVFTLTHTYTHTYTHKQTHTQTHTHSHTVGCNIFAL